MSLPLDKTRQDRPIEQQNAKIFDFLLGLSQSLTGFHQLTHSDLNQSYTE
jgi:hypothetical protein